MPRSTNPYHPKQLPLWLLFGLLRLIVFLPIPFLLWLGRGTGRLLMRLSKRRHHIAITNIQLAFPELSADEQKQLVKRHFESVGMALFEMVIGWWSSSRRLEEISQIDGLENLLAAQKKGGVIIMGAHFTTLDIMGRFLSLKARFDVTYRRNENPVIEKMFHDNREKNFEMAIVREDARSMLKNLKKGNTIWFAPDQNYAHKHSVFSPFFGVNAATTTAMSRFTKTTGASLVPLFFQRLDDHGHYRLRLLPALEDFPSDDPQKDTDRINQLMEEYIRLCPEQYLWIHRRYKDRPQGEASLY